MKRNILYFVLGLLLIVSGILIAQKAEASTTVMTGAFPNSSAFSGTAPTSFTDLDLSSIVGANEAIVTLRVDNTSGSNNNFAFRPNGQSYDTTYNNANQGIENKTSTDTLDSSVIINTDSAGIIEWKGSSALSTTIYVTYYLKQVSIQEENTTTLPWSSITSKPTTLSGYGITDAYPLTGNPSGFLTTGGSIATLSDVTLTSLTDLDMLQWDATSSKWINVIAPGGGGGGCSTFGCLTGTEDVLQLDETTQYGIAIMFLGAIMLLTLLGIIYTVQKTL